MPRSETILNPNPKPVMGVGGSPKLMEVEFVDIASLIKRVGVGFGHSTEACLLDAFANVLGQRIYDRRLNQPTND